MNHSTNATCPALENVNTISSTENPTIDHIACFGAYQPGVAGANVSQTLHECCNNTVAVAKNIYITNRDDPSYENCWYYCNATRNDINEDTGAGFYQVEQCVKVNRANFDYDTGLSGKYQIMCFPKQERSVAVPSIRPLSSLGFGMVVLVLGAMVLA
jgi:hypothetical protein